MPALRFTQFDTNHLKYCTTREDALKVDGIIYNTAIQNLANKVCGSICTVTKYHHKLSLLSKNVLSKELKTYGDGYFIIWQFYSSLYVNEKVEKYMFDFDTALVAIGGSLGLFLGWSITSMVLYLAELTNEKLFKSKSKSEITQVKSSVTTPSKNKTRPSVWEQPITELVNDRY